MSQRPIQPESDAGPFTISNGLSLLRALMAIPTAIAMLSHQKTVAIVLFFISASTDYFDGLVARVRNEVSEFGRIADPIADKIYVAVAVILMLILDYVPLWLVIAILARDLLIMIGGIIIQRRTGDVLASNWTGKWTVGAISVTLLLLYMEVSPPVTTIFLLLTVAMLILSLALYVRVGVQHLATSDQTEIR